MEMGTYPWAPKSKLYLGHVPVVGNDDLYPQDRNGKPILPTKFTIRAEKCPNRRGVEEVLQKFQGDVLSFDQAARAAEAGRAFRRSWIAALRLAWVGDLQLLQRGLQLGPRAGEVLEQLNLAIEMYDERLVLPLP